MASQVNKSSSTLQIICQLAGFLFALGACGSFPSNFAWSQSNSNSAPRLDRWEVLGPGGGGAQFNPTISPVDPNLVLVSCDMTGSYISLDGGNSWRMFNLRGVVRFFVADPRDSNIIYAATEGLYRSRNKGKTWDLIYPVQNDFPKPVISGDHAEERLMTRQGIHSVVNALAVDPDDSNSLFAAISVGGKSGLYHSQDGAKSWQILASLPTAAGKIYIDPFSPRSKRKLFVALANSVAVLENGVLQSQTGPAAVDRFLDIAGGFSKQAAKPVFYAVSGLDWRGGNTGITGLFLSADGGANWRKIPIDFLSQAPAGAAELELRAVGTSFHHPETAYLSFRDHSKSLTANQRAMGVAKTADSGKTWHFVWRDTETESAANVQDPWISRRFGPGWGENPFALGVSPNDPDICFATDFGRTTRTRDGGQTWQGVYARTLDDGSSVTTGLDVLTTHGIHFDPFDPTHWFVSFTDIGLFESRQNGHSWKEASSRGIPEQWQNTAYWVVFDPSVKGRIWAAVSDTHDLPRPKMWRRVRVGHYLGGVVISEDGGNTWKPSSDGMAQTAAVHILLDQSSSPSARTLYVCGFGKGVYKSTDGGRHWLLKNTGLEGTEPFAWRSVQDANGQLYLLAARRSENGKIGTSGDGALYRSTDGAEHWQKLNLPSGCNAPNGLAIDPRDPNRLYLAAWGRPVSSEVSSGDTGGGIFLSTNAGETWRNVLDRDQHIFDVTIDPNKPNVLYATGFESAVWKSTDLGEDWTRVKGYDFKWGQRVFLDPANTQMIYVCTYGGAIWHGPADAADSN